MCSYGVLNNVGNKEINHNNNNVIDSRITVIVIRVGNTSGFNRNVFLIAKGNSFYPMLN